MANTLGNYNVPLYAQEALISLRKRLGFANRVHLGYDSEMRAHNRGETINIRKPASFVAQSAPSSAQAVSTTSIPLVLNQWQEVKFSLTDKEVATTEKNIIEDHIPNAAYAIADAIDQSMVGLYKDIPWVLNTASTAVGVADIAAARRILTNNQVPMANEAMLHYMVGAEEEEALVQLAAFSQWQGAGAQGVETQMTGQLGKRYGLNFWTNQNRQSHTPGTLSDLSIQVAGATSAGATQITLDAGGGALTGTLVAGDSFVIAGNTQRYAVTATATAAANAITVSITPPLAQDHADNDLVTVDAEATKVKQSLAFHQHAFAVAFGKLPDYGDRAGGLGAQVFSVQDDVTGIAVRARVFYVGDSSAVYCAIDALWGVKTLNPNLALRIRQA